MLPIDFQSIDALIKKPSNELNELERTSFSGGDVDNQRMLGFLLWVGGTEFSHSCHEHEYSPFFLCRCADRHLPCILKSVEGYLLDMSGRHTQCT